MTQAMQDPAAEAKRLAAQRACEAIENGMIIGLGTGSTADWAVKRIGDLVAGGMRLQGIPTSERTLALARQVGVPLTTLDDVERVDLTIDGADEVDPRLDLVKGLGGALLREKIVASVSERVIIVVDPSKLVPKLGTRSPIPVEVLQFGWRAVERTLAARGLAPTLRVKAGVPFLTDNGNFVLDCRVAGVKDPRELERDLNTIPGVIDNGLFLGVADRVVVGDPVAGIREMTR